MAKLSLEETVRRFIDSDVTGTELDDSVKPTPMTGKSISNLEDRTSSATSPSKKDGGLGKRTAIIIRSITLKGIHEIQDPNIIDVGKQVSTNTNFMECVLHFGIPAGSTSITVDELENITKLYRFYQLGSHLATVTPQASAGEGFVAEVEMRGVNYGVITGILNESLQYEESKRTPAKKLHSGGPSSKRKTGQKTGSVEAHKTGKKEVIGGEKPLPGNTQDFNDPKSWEGPGPPHTEKRKKALIELRKLDRSNIFPIVNNKYGIVYPSAGSKYKTKMYKDKSDIPFLEARRDNIESHFQLVSIPLKNYKDEQFYKFKAKIGAYVGDLVELRGSGTSTWGAPQAVIGTERTMKSLRNIEKIWTDLRIEALKAGKPDPGSALEVISNGYRSRQVNFWRSMSSAERKTFEDGLYWIRHGNKYTPKQLNNWDHSHTLGQAVDIHANYGFFQSQPRALRKLHNINWKRMMVILSRLVWAGDFSQDDKKTAMVGFGYGLYHFHVGLRRPGLINGRPGTHWAYSSPIIPPEWKQTKPDAKKPVVYPYFSYVVKYGVSKFTEEMNKTYPNWTKVLKKHGVYPKEF